MSSRRGHVNLFEYNRDSSLKGSVQSHGISLSFGLTPLPLSPRRAGWETKVSETLRRYASSSRLSSRFFGFERFGPTDPSQVRSWSRSLGKVSGQNPFDLRVTAHH